MTTVTDQELSLLSISESQVAFNQDQKKAIIDVLRVKHATDADMAVFFHMARHTGLDPFRRQLYMLARQEYNSETRTKEWRQTFQTGIDGYRLIAERYARSRNSTLVKATFRYWDNDGIETSAWWKSEPPAMIRATVQVVGEEPVSWDARFAEYVPLKDEYVDVIGDDGKPIKDSSGKTKTEKSGRRVPQGMWATRPTAQLEKCAEAGALRRACPEDLAGLYVDAEMQRTDDVESVTVLSETTVHTASNRDWIAEIDAVEKTAKEKKIDPAEILREIYRESTKAGERSTAISEAISAKVAALQPTKEAETEESADEKAAEAGLQRDLDKERIAEMQSEDQAPEGHDVSDGGGDFTPKVNPKFYQCEEAGEHLKTERHSAIECTTTDDEGLPLPPSDWQPQG